MADIRINALANTASSTASDDYLAVDGTTNGTRKLSAYSPTFGGNLTVSGTSSFAGNVNISLAAANESARFTITNTEAGGWGNTLNLVGTGSDAVARTMASFLSSATGSWANAANSSSILYLRTLNAGTLTTGVTLSGAGNVSVAGNLTVSGTGTSSVAGNLGVGTTSPASRLHAKTVGTAGQNTDVLTLDNIPTAVSNGNGTGVLFRSTLNDGAGTNAVNAARIYSFLTNGTPSAEYFSLALQTMNAGTLTTAATLTGSGNLLIGTTTDGGQKLQVAGDIAMTNGSGNGTLTVTNNANKSAFVQAAGSTAYLGSGAAGMSCILVSGNGATALTLDSSQNATFAGSIAINNTVQTAVAVASTHKVTISIGGSTYYLLATNV